MHRAKPITTTIQFYTRLCLLSGKDESQDTHHNVYQGKDGHNPEASHDKFAPTRAIILDMAVLTGFRNAGCEQDACPIGLIVDIRVVIRKL